MRLSETKRSWCHRAAIAGAAVTVLRRYRLSSDSIATVPAATHKFRNPSFDRNPSRRCQGHNDRQGLRRVAALAFGLSAHAVDITGAGATFPFPIYAKWAEAYKQKTGIGMNYQSIGSGAGIKQIQAKTVDFGATDAPLKGDELAKAGLVQFPAIIGGVVPVVNLEGIKPGELKLTGPVLADIYFGKIKKWNEKAIADLNPGVKLPDENITVVRRSDGSGTTFLWTDYLSKVSPEWKEKVGSSTAVAWPEGVGGKGNEGVASYVQRIKGAIGYVEYAYAKKNKMSARRACATRMASSCSPTTARSRPRPVMPTGSRSRASTRSSPSSPARRAGRSPARASS